MKVSPSLPRVARIVAFAVAGLQVLSGLFGSVAALPPALIPIFAGVGIKRGRVWSAYGFGLFVLAQLLLVPLILTRPGNSATVVYQAIGAAVIGLAEAVLFFLAGKALSDDGAERGSPFPWIVLSVLFIVPLFFVQPFSIPTGAMEDTILVGDRILVHTFPAPHPVTGDLIVFSYPPDHKQTFVKRIVGMAGDHIRISGKTLYRNGVQLAEPYVVHKTNYEDPFRDNFPGEPNAPMYPSGQEMLTKSVVNGEVVVPPGRYFVLGDNRDFSLDSRYWGFVSSDELIGKPFLIYDSKDQSTDNLMARSPILQWHHTRWGRLFKAI